MRPSVPTGLLRLGSRGAAVRTLQQRLQTLGYFVGPADGIFGDATAQAVLALQKLAGIARDAVVGPQTRAALAAGVRGRPRARPGRNVQIDLAHQVLLIAQNGHLIATLNTSTGGDYRFCSGGVCGDAVTPRGVFRITRQIDALVHAPLGELWRPKYFIGGVAIHGATSVPAIPVSHGCVRVGFAAMDWIWAQNLAPLGTPVWVY